MKNRYTTPVSKTKIATKLTLVAAAILMAVTVPMSSYVPIASADQYDDAINAKKKEKAELDAKAADLRQQANTLQNELARLSAEKATIQAQIDLSQATLDKLNADIVFNEQKIIDNKDALGDIIASIYLEGKTTPLEMIASSNTISDYVDKQEYQNSVRSELSDTIDEIKKLKKELETQREDVNRVLADQTTQRANLAQKEGEQQQILAQTRGDEATYQQLSSAKSAEIDALRAQQAAELAARARSVGGRYTSLPGDGSRGGYPSLWANAPMNAYVDSWGMYSRQCVSYAAFKVSTVHGNMPYWGGVGNANQWPGNARAAGIKTSSSPARNTVGIVSAGTYGHAAWVESVNADGTINISHYNVGWGGEYAQWHNLDPSYFDTYIYFGG